MAVALKAGDRYTENDGYDRRIRSVDGSKVIVEYLRGEEVIGTEVFSPGHVESLIRCGQWGQLLAPAVAPEAENEAPDFEQILAFTIAWLDAKYPAALRELHEDLGRELDKRGLSRG